MQIIQFNHKTAANLLKKSVKEYWLDDNKDAYIRFTDGSVVCVHQLNNSWEAYVVLRECTHIDRDPSVHDGTDTYTWCRSDGDGTCTSRTVGLNFDIVDYYLHYSVNYVTRQYIPVVEFHYYEKGEEIGSHR